MDKLESLGLRIDNNENLKIISAEAEIGSLELSATAKLVIAGLEDLKERLDRKSDLIKILDQQASEVRLASLVYQVSKLIKS